MSTSTVTVVKAAKGYRVERDGVTLGRAWNNGSRSTYGRNWTYTVVGQEGEGRCGTLRGAASAIERAAK